MIPENQNLKGLMVINIIKDIQTDILLKFKHFFKMVDGFKKSQLIMTIEMHCYTEKNIVNQYR